MSATTFRVDLRAALKTTLDAYTNAGHAFDLVATIPERPMSYARETPYAFLEFDPELITHDSGLRTRNAHPKVYTVDRWTDNFEVAVRQDALRDALIDAFTDAPHLVANTIWSDMTVSDGLVDQGDSRFVVTEYDFGDVSIREGRT